MPAYLEDLKQFGCHGVDGGVQMLMTKLEAANLQVKSEKPANKQNVLEQAAATGEVPESDLYALRQNG